MAYNTAIFNNMVYAELGLKGDRPELKGASVGAYNDLTDSNMYAWYINGKSVYSYSAWTNFFDCGYYDGLMVNGMAIIAFYGTSSNGYAYNMDNSSIHIRPNSVLGKTYSNIVLPLTEYHIVESPNIRGITLATGESNDVFYDYTLRVYVIPGTQHPV